MARIFQEFFQVNLVAAESGLGFGAGRGDGINERGFGAHNAHAAAAAPGASLNNDGVADLAGCGDDCLGVVREGAVATRYAGHARLNHRALGVYLVAHQADRVAAGADKGKAAFFHTVGKVGVFREKAVTGVNGFGVGDFGCGNNGRNVEVAFRRGRRTDTDALIGELNVHGVGVCGGMHDNGFDVEHAAGALNPQCNLTAVGNQNLSEHELFW